MVVLFQPAEETGDGARAMVDDGLAKLIPTPDVALAGATPRRDDHVPTEMDGVASRRDVDAERGDEA